MLVRNVVTLLCHISVLFHADAVQACRTVAESVRAKSAIERSVEEKEWIAVDRVMFPALYDDAVGMVARSQLM